ncbi:type IV pilus modification protein PilV [Cardiobacterium valvarum]|uniref:Type IV pilus modification protein PilV n=1 Tax=Cardiobacterium valvarum F0432 TaxID=797473 RepID=G9ZI48_9GAMM|nr:type IV pilus modification protein PilV [Cardiobacterium valvarum]EHM52207.1 type IV pilus modification protein PilV [Cardiobacterium valvarum F0432]
MEKRKNKLVGTLCTHQKGMTLLEIVISMLIVALGLAMSVSMIQTANRFGDTAEFTAFAQQKSQQIIDAMRANNIARDTYLLDWENTATQGNIDYKQLYNNLNAIYNVTDITGRLRCKNSGRCTESENIAKQDMKVWIEEIRSLPGGRGIIRQRDNQYEVVVMWRHVSETDRGEDTPVQGTRVWFTL